MSLENTVVGKIVERARAAYQSKVPLLMLDTEELELVEETAQCSGFVDLVKHVTISTKEGVYYEFLGGDPSGLVACVNYKTKAEDLLTVMSANGKLDMSALPHLFVLQINEDSILSDVGYLRAYVHSYLRCRDNHSPLRCSCVFLYGTCRALPKDLHPYTEIIEVDYPDQQEIRQEVCAMTEKYGHTVEDFIVREIAQDLAGFSLMAVRRNLMRLLCSDQVNGKPPLFDKDIRAKVIQNAKKQAFLQNGGLLELQEKIGDKKNTLGGMVAYSKWVKDNRERLIDPGKYMQERGLPPLKGVLLCGVPGCGKSEAAQILQQELDNKLPLIKMDIGRLMGGHLGDSERNMREALKQAEAMSPSIVWLDELEKGFAGASANSSSDGGTFKRVFALLLSWMQDSTAPCFLFATANDISQLPQEFFRSGRFDVLFSVYMPTYEECKAIFAEQMKRLDRNRQKIAAERGEVPPTYTMFADGQSGSLSEEVLNQVMDIFAKKKLFLSGADIKKIVALACAKVDIDGSSIIGSDWVKAVEKVANDPTLTVQGGSSAGLDSIAACSLRLLRGNFVPTCDPKLLLLKKEDYHVEWDAEKQQPKASYKKSSCCSKADYDKALQATVVQRINRMATTLECAAQHRLMSV